MLVTFLITAIILLSLIAILAAIWWWVLFKDFCFGFIGKFGGLYEKTASVVIQILLPIIIGIICYVISLLLDYVDSISEFIVRII